MAEKKIGRPTKYKPEYCQKIIDYFSVDPYEEVTESKTIYKDGTTKEIYGLRANDPVLMGTFARVELGVSKTTMLKWVELYPDFMDAYKRAKELQLQFMVTNGVKGLYASTPWIFTMKNMFEWRDRSELEHSGIPENRTYIYVSNGISNSDRSNRDQEQVLPARSTAENPSIDSKV